ncbi:MAG: isopentenyl phosphate kinase [Thermoplasmata archaeon]
MLFLVKLGGSVITDKMRTCKFKTEVVDRLAWELSQANMKGILVTGAGSFGHILAKKYKLNEGLTSCDFNQISGLARVQRDVRVLNLKICNALLKYNLSPVSLPPSAMVRCRLGKISSLDHTIFKYYLDLGTIPVTFGDVVLDSERGFCICSGDLMMEELSREFKFDFAVFVTDVDGVFDSDPKVCRSAKLIKEIKVDAKVENLLRDEAIATIDVTGKMLGKVKSALRIASNGTDVYIINGLVPGRLKALLLGEKVVCTKIKGRKAVEKAIENAEIKTKKNETKKLKKIN